MITATVFFGDKERPFTLTDELVTELETTTGTGIGTLFQRLMAQAFKLGDLAEVIRLGLIGGGANPKRPSGW
ncbi:GTA-gp10 family protein [Paracoccus cavernae]|uniref:GTA-gp10 family protein n=1 Tax=Paracoccus cavernae TaxID=1571207 RepID=UPI003643FDA0